MTPGNGASGTATRWSMRACRPAEVRSRLHVEDLDHQRVAGARAADLHRTGERVAAERAAAQDVVVGRGLRVEAVGGVAGLEHDGIAGLDLQPGRQRVVPLLVDLVVAELVGLHAASLLHATMPVPERQAMAGM